MLATLIIKVLDDDKLKRRKQGMGAFDRTGHEESHDEDVL